MSEKEGEREGKKVQRNVQKIVSKYNSFREYVVVGSCFKIVMLHTSRIMSLSKKQGNNEEYYIFCVLPHPGWNDKLSLNLSYWHRKYN